MLNTRRSYFSFFLFQSGERLFIKFNFGTKIIYFVIPAGENI